MKQNPKSKTNIPPVQILSKTNSNPPNPIIEDVSDKQPNDKQSSNTSPLAGNIEESV